MENTRFQSSYSRIMPALLCKLCVIAHQAKVTVYVYVHMFVCAHLCMLRPEVNFSCFPSGAFYLVFEMNPLLGQKLTD